MADLSSPRQFEDLPLEEARRLSRGLRMDPELYNALKQKIQSRDNIVTRLMIPEGTSLSTMKNRILGIR